MQDLRAKTALLAHMRHELRTPVNAILGYSEMLLEDAEAQALAPATVADLRKIHAAGETLLALINDILDAGKIEQRKDIDLDEFGAKIRHGLRTPVDTVIGYSEMLLEDAPEAVAADLKRIETSGRRLLALLEDLVRMSQGDAAKAGAASEVSASVTSMIADVVRTMEGADERAVEVGKLLVVDDNEINRDMLQRRLTRQGHTVAAVESGRVALGRLSTEEFDLVLLDVMMPEMNGFQVLERLKSDEKLRHIPVIMISALDEIDSVVRCIEMGAEDYLPKNFNPTLLRARIGACLEKKRLRDREVLHLRQIEEEKKRSDELLHVILPDEIVRELKTDHQVRPRRYEEVAVMFCDIVGFTPYCAHHQPDEVVMHLQELVSIFEVLAVRHDLLKVKTIGDSFMATAGALKHLENPVRNAVLCGLEMTTAARATRAGWSVRCGIHVGPVTAGVVGHQQYLFDFFGDTVNTAARVESNGVPGAVNVSAEAWKRIAGLFRGESRGLIKLKGLGEMEVYRVDGVLE